MSNNQRDDTDTHLAPFPIQMAGHLEALVGLDVQDDEAYSEYRAGIAPILASFGGSFGYDFRVSEVLRSESEVEINRVFTIRFPDEDAMDAFFHDAAYLEVKTRFFDPSVRGFEVLAQYRVESDV